MGLDAILNSLNDPQFKEAARHVGLATRINDLINAVGILIREHKHRDEAADLMRHAPRREMEAMRIEIKHVEVGRTADLFRDYAMGAACLGAPALAIGFSLGLAIASTGLGVAALLGALGGRQRKAQQAKEAADKTKVAESIEAIIVAVQRHTGELSDFLSVLDGRKI